MSERSQSFGRRQKGIAQRVVTLSHDAPDPRAADERLGATTLLFAYLVYLVSKDSSIASFDPYNILSLDRGATDKQIKKAYKLKALEFHPDKNIGDERAAQMFMMVAKAYEALTDEQAKENWEKYGNPDGKQSFEMSIGLPTFLMDGENHNVILLVYLLIMVIAVPVVVYMIYTNSQMYGENNILYATTGRYGQRMLRGKRAPRLGGLRALRRLRRGDVGSE